ncbi:ketosynthase [Streptomyces alkaliphilus]|uniref:ketosynthase n=1 Tax=Streptomyces alkaliphilus TaxID=1472722 RepID=UPI00117BEC51|nr:ketosynthase [Streptomyces alkaliphilus]MQS06045.1 ketosynthase [Streptomyces alkaliphilus]
MTSPEIPENPPAPALVVGAAAIAWPVSGDGPPAVPGFVESRFNPLVRAAVDRCLDDAAPARPERFTGRTAVLLLTLFGDATTTDLAGRRLQAGRAHNPLLFHQSVPTSILGFVSREHGLRGALTCLSVDAASLPAAFETAELILADDEVDQLLLVGVELVPTRRAAAVRRRLQPPERISPGQDAAVALLLRPAREDPAPDGAVGVDLRAAAGTPGCEAPGIGPLHGLGSLWATIRAARRAPALTP